MGITGFLAMPFCTTMIRRLRSGVPFWYRPKMYTTTMRPYDAPHRNWIIVSRYFTLGIFGAWCFANRYTDRSKVTDEGYVQHSKAKLAASYKNETQL